MKELDKGAVCAEKRNRIDPKKGEKDWTQTLVKTWLESGMRVLGIFGA